MEIIRIHEDKHASADPVLQEYLDAKADSDRAQSRLVAAQQHLMEQMREKHQKSLAWTHNGTRKTVTYVRREITEIDEKGLRRALRAAVFDKYTVKKLDRKAMEQAMATGEIDPLAVAPYVHPKETSPYLKYSESVDKGEEHTSV